MIVSPALAGRSVVVTGGSSGIGRAIALGCARAGATVALTFRENESGARAVQREIASLGCGAHVFRLNIADSDAARAFAGEAAGVLGQVDAWINNAGADILTGPTANASVLERLDQLIAVDLRGTMMASWQAVELMSGQPDGGVLINMSWDHVITGMSGTNPELFAAVKGGVLAFSKALARSAAPKVRVNVLAPGWIDTSFGEGLDPARRETIARSIPLQRWGTPEDVAAAAVFLASPSAAYMTGQTLFVGGGAVM
jgi:3-oxoacyl-[acyl-carrier protein] reductase